MKLRARLAVLTSLAVALSIVAASLVLWLLIRSSLMADIDERMLERVPHMVRIGQMTRVELPPDEGTTGERRAVLDGEPMGLQQVTPEGAVTFEVPPGDIDLALDVTERRLLEGDSEGPQLRTVTVQDASYRVMSTTASDGNVVRLILPLARVETTMAGIAWLLVGVAGTGVAVAGAVGWMTAKAGLRPVDRLVAAAEQVATTNDLAHRIEVRGNQRDEIARLAGSVNAMLSALDDARVEQRELVENAGHELRTPLATLRNDLGLLVSSERHPERTLAPTDRARLLEDLETEVAGLSDLVGEVIDLARGEVEPEPPVEVDVRALAERAVTRARRVNPQVTVIVRGTSGEAAVRPAALERAIVNLVRNAIQVSHDDGLVELVVADDNGSLSVRVLDRGPGIHDQDLPRLFDRFYRGADARERQGSGLGLAIVAQVARLHEGSVEAGNRDGGGAVFTLRIPAVRSSRADS